MAEESDDDFNDQVVVKSKRFDGAIIKPILQGNYFFILTF